MIALGPATILRHTYISLFLILIGLVVFSVAISSSLQNLDYQAAPSCGEIHAADCRDPVQLQVSSVETWRSKSGEQTTIHFVGGHSATFYSDDVAPTAVEVGSLLPAEVWRGSVTAVVIDGKKHLSFASRSDSWIGIVGGGGFLVLGLTWFLIELAMASMDPDVGRTHDTFASPVRVRRALYVLLAVFSAALIVLGLGFLALLAGSVPTADTLAAISLVVGVLSVPALMVVFLAWFVRAYLNVGALGLRIRHSGWFVGVALVLPPISLYMPYRLAREVVTKTQATMPEATLRIWWLSAVAWLLLTIAGMTIGSSDPTNTTPLALASDALMVASIGTGLVAAILTVRLIRSVDAREQAIAQLTGVG